MTEHEVPRSDDERDVEQRETDRAEEEAREVGGKVEPLTDDPEMEPAEEGGEGESEGFEQAERRLEEIAEHGDEHRFPDADARDVSEAGAAEGGEADDVIPADG